MPGRGRVAQMYKDIDVLKTPHNQKKIIQNTLSPFLFMARTLLQIKMPDFYLLNLYSFPNSSLGLHQDRVEKDLNNPVL